ncbi:MAG: NAD(P)/FAD-dependent oxidoreductase [Bacteroidetes bacterium]|nr:NAD(P)/FAD-dependent oxidoreductase [Bacteroidota bacterium]
MESVHFNTDVCIIGAGPAGSAASLALSKNQIKHIIVDAASFPRQKPCADVITAGVLRMLNEIDPNIIRSLREKNEINPIWQSHIYPTNNKPLKIAQVPFGGSTDEPSCYCISRINFDSILLNKVKESTYATVMEKCRISALEKESDGIKLFTKNGECIKAKLVIVATGSNNSVLKLLNLEQSPKYCNVGIRAYYKNVDCAKETGELFFDKRIMPGGVFITPLPNNEYNVNMVLSLQKANRKNIPLKEMIEEIIATNPVLKQKFSKATRISKFEGSKLYLGIQKRTLTGDRFLLAGDSAGLIDFITANGIYQAMLSGKLAALKAQEALAQQNFSKEFLQSYEDEIYTRIEKFLAMGRLFYPLLRIRFFNWILLGLLNFISKRPNTNSLMQDIFHHRISKKRLMHPKLYYDLLFKKGK